MDRRHTQNKKLEFPFEQAMPKQARHDSRVRELQQKGRNSKISGNKSAYIKILHLPLNPKIHPNHGSDKMFSFPFIAKAPIMGSTH